MDLDAAWSSEKMRRAASDEPEQVRDAIEVLAVVIEELHRVADDADAAPVQVTPAQWRTASNVLAWWQHANCESRSMSSDLHDPELNPSGLTGQVPLTNDGEAPQLEPTDDAIVIAPDGSASTPEDFVPNDQQTITFFADVDRRCFALGRFVPTDPAESDEQADAKLLAAVTDAANRKSCLSAPVTDSAGRQVRWNADYDGWNVQVIESKADEPGAADHEHVWDLTEDLYIVATPPAS